MNSCNSFALNYSGQPPWWGQSALCMIMRFDFYISDKGNPSVMEEVRKVFRSSSTSGFDPRNPIDRRERGKGGKKKAAATKYLPQSKQQNTTVFKNVVCLSTWYPIQLNSRILPRWQCATFPPIRYRPRVC